MDPIVLAAGTALIGAMATDAWQQARAGIVALWRRARPQEAGNVERELAEVRAEVVAARQVNDADTEQALTGAWQLRLQQLLRSDPALASALRRVLDETLTPALPPAERIRIGRLIMRGSSHDSSTFNQVAGDQINYQS